MSYGDFARRDVQLWNAVADVAQVERLADGMAFVPSGSVPTILSPPLALHAPDISFVRIRMRSPISLRGARLGWSVADPSGGERFAGLNFDMPRQMRGGFARTVWLPVSASDDWAGEIRRLGLAIPLNGSTLTEPLVVESIDLWGPTLWTGIQRGWTDLGLVQTAEHMVLPLWSMMSIGRLPVADAIVKGYPTPPRDRLTVHGYGGILAAIAVLGMRVGRRPESRRIARSIARSGSALMTGLLAVMIILGIYLEAAAWWMDRSAFAGRSSEEILTSIDGLDLVGSAVEVNRLLPRDSSVELCLFDDGWFGEVMFWRTRYQFYPIHVTPQGHPAFFTKRIHQDAHNPYLLVFRDHPGHCPVSDRQPLIQQPTYTLYRPA
ncbi:MAG: hypothetical protein ABIO65_10535 [Nitrospiria bacterium]